MKRFPVALALMGAALAAGCAGGSSSKARPASARPTGSVVGTLVEVAGEGNGGGLMMRRPAAHRSFVVSPVSGGVYRIITNASGRFHFRGRPGVYYPRPSSGFTPFRVVAGRTTRVVLYVGAAWKGLSAS
jgi:hypothetical protein